jgi:hypothetical protein
MMDCFVKYAPDFFTQKRKVFEPCSGKGQFVIDIVDRFMKGLANLYPDEKERYKVIVEECIYWADINPTNTYITKILLDPFDNYELNYYLGDTLELDIKEQWGLSGFDAVIGNPPYQAVSEGGVSKGGGNNLYTKFIYFADSVLVQEGYILYINPPTYFSPGRSINKNDRNLRKDVLDKYKYYYINLEECSKHFNVGSKFIYYLIQKNNDKNDKLEVICKYNKKIYKSIMRQQDIQDVQYLPYFLTNESMNILSKIKNSDFEKLNIFNSPDNRTDKKHVMTKMKSESEIQYKNRAEKEGFIYPMKATGIQIVYSSKKCKNQNDKKVLMSESGYLRPVYDDGYYGVGGHCFALLVKDQDEGDKVVELLNSRLYRFYIETNKWSGFHHKEVLQDLPNIINDLIEINDKEIYKCFDMTKEDIKYIENFM